MKEVIMVTAKLYSYRDTCKKFYKDEYKQAIEPYQNIIQQVMNANKEDALQALLRISKSNAYQENGMGQLLFISATVELIEPSV